MARPTSCVPDAGRAGDPALTLLLSVLQSVQGAAKTLESNVQVEERMHLSILRMVAFSTWEVMSPLASAGLDDEIASYTEVVLEAVEVAFDIRCDHDEFDCPIWKKSLGRHYPNCHALCHLSTTKGCVSFCNAHARSVLVERLTETFSAFENHRAEHSELAGPTKKQPRASQWEIAKSMSQAFHAMSKCREAMADCDVRDKLEARLALATYWNLEDDGYHTIDMLFALGHQTPQWDEVRIHMNSEALVSQKQKRPVVRFAEPGCSSPAASSAYTWRKPVPVKVQHFCSLLEARRARINARMAINLTLATENAVLDHKPTKRIANSADLSRSISLADILSSNEGNLCQMAKLLLSVTLGYALFYLYDTPWLTSEGKSVQWDHENIMFFAKDNRVLLRPYIRYKLGRNQDHESDEDCEEMGSIHPYPALVSFAITLLEIHLGHSLRSHLGDVPMETEDDKWASAQEVFEEQKEFIPWPNYRNAIEACLDPDFVDSEMEADYDSDNIEDDSNGADGGGAHLKHLRTLIYQIIVCPIYDELDRAYGEFINHHDIDKHAAEMDLFHGSSVTTNQTQAQNQSQMAISAPAALHHTTLNEGVSMFKTMKSGMKMDMKMSMKSNFMSAVTVSPMMAKIPLEPRINIPQSLPIMLKNGAVKDEPVNGGFYTVFGSSQASNPGEDSLADGWFKQYEGLNSLEPLKEIEPGNPERVRVAIIDTGINMGHPDIRAAEESGVIIKVCDFVDGKEGVPNMNAGDSCGHGTHVASIILGMAPNVDLYIARVTEGPKMSGTQADNIARAINTAVNVWNCSIINLSLGFDGHITSIDQELKKALDANILVFAAASNEGGNRGITYPAWCPRVFCIHSTDSYGNPSKFNPTPDDHNSNGDRFSVLGESIKGVWPTSTDEDPLWPRQSGTSFAAPVAASLAACLLGVASQWQIQSAVQLASYDGMRRVFKTMANPRGGYEYLNPFSFFNRDPSYIMNDLQQALNPRRR